MREGIGYGSAKLILKSKSGSTVQDMTMFFEAEFPKLKCKEGT